MKRTLSIILAVFTCYSGAIAQQNLVPNGDFEFVNSCPTGISQPNVCTGWDKWTNATSDYFNSCFTNTTSGPGVPINFRGYQQAHSGNAYMGGYSGTSASNPTYKEYITRPIIPMQIGVAYEVSLSVNLSNISGYATNDVGVFFYDNVPSSLGISNTAPYTPQVEWPNIIVTDTQDWVRLTKVFIADSAYDNIAIGCFRDNNSGISISPLPTGTSCYYYFDSIVVKVYDSLVFGLNKQQFCAGDTFTMPYYSLKKKQSNNVFTLQLSDATGSFASPITIGSATKDTSGTMLVTIPLNTTTGTGYRMRLLASNFADTSEISTALSIGAGIIKPVANNNGPVCANDTLRLSVYSSTTGVTYSWTGPNSFTSTMQNPQFNTPLPINSGDYTVTAKLYGCEAKDTTTVVVFAGSGPTNPTATSNAPVCIDDTLKLYGSATGTNLSYSWTGPDNFSANTQNVVIPDVTNIQGGDYVLYTGNGNCVSRDTVNVIVKPRPANFSATYNAPVCESKPLNLSATSTSTGVTYAWTGPNSFTSTNASPTFTYALPIHSGNYYVTATLNGCSLNDTVAVTVIPQPVKPTATVNTPVCEGTTLNFTATTTTTGVSYIWTGPNSFTANIANTTISNTTTAASGDYIVTVTKDGCINTDTVTALVKPLPAVVSPSNNGPICAGSNLQISIPNSTTGATYSWTGPSSYNANQQNNTINNATTAASGWYVVTVDLNGCNYKDSTNATVNLIPAAPVLSYNSPMCVGETLLLSANTATGATYSWTGPNSFSATAQNPTKSNMQFSDTGKFTATRTVNGCTSAPTDIHVAINPQPFTVIFPQPGDTICVGQNATFTAIPNNHGGSPQYKWFINGAATGNTSTSFSTTTLSDGDVIRCDMTENTKCHAAYTDQSNEINMVVMPWLAPSVTFTQDPNRPLKVDEYVTFTATPKDAGPAPTFQWKRNGQNVQGATGAIWSANTLNDNDSISVEVISNYRCPQPPTASANGVRVKILAGVEQFNESNDLSLFPNPNNGTFQLKGTLATTEEVTIQVYNAIGQTIHQQTIQPTSNTINTQIQLGDVAAGVYMLKLTTKEATYGVRFNVK